MTRVARMSLTVVGSIAFDAVKTPFGERERMLGGAATHFALAASFFDEVRVVGPVGDDFGEDEYAVLHDARRRSPTTSSTSRAARRSSGGASTSQTSTRARRSTPQLNVFEHFEPKLSQASQDCDVLFLANIQPDLQREVREQCERRAVRRDGLDGPVDQHRARLARATIASVDCADPQRRGARACSRGSRTSCSAAREILGWGPKVVVAKQGKYGAALFTDEGFFALPAYPLESRRRPDRRGRLVRRRLRRLRRRPPAARTLDHDLLRRAMAYGTALASFNVEEFGTERVARLTADEITGRVAELQRITHFERRAGRAARLTSPWRLSR